MKKQIFASVREIVDFVLRSGDINASYISSQKMQLGQATHTKLQKQRKQEAKAKGISYKSEYPLSFSFNYRDFDFTIDGRADGIFIVQNKAIIEEIKSTSLEPDSLEADENHWHFAQAKFYGYFYCVPGSGISPGQIKRVEPISS